MARRFFHISLLVLALISLSACGTKKRSLTDVPTMYEISNSVVTGNVDISPDLMRGLQARMVNTLQSSHRPYPRPRAIIDIHMISSVTVKRYEGLRTESQLSVALTDVGTGYPVQIRNFTILSFAADRRMAHEAAAEAIAARMRVEYSLVQPRLRGDDQEPIDISTRMAADAKPAIEPEDTKSTSRPIKQASVPESVDATVTEEAQTPAAIQKPETSVVETNSMPENGARVKFVIRPSLSEAEPSTATTEPCVETLEKTCK